MLALGLVVAVIALIGPRADRLMRQNVIGQHQRMAAHGVAEMKADPVPLHLAAGEVEVGFTILHRVFQHRIVLRQLHIQRRIAELGIVRQQLAQDLGDGPVVKDPLVAPPSCQPEPRAQHQIIAVAVLAHPGPSRLRDDAVKGLGALTALDLDRGMGTDERVEVEIIAGGQRLDTVFEQVVEMVGAVKAQKRQHVSAKRGGQTAETLGLAKGGTHEQLLRKRESFRPG